MILCTSGDKNGERAWARVRKRLRCLVEDGSNFRAAPQFRCLDAIRVLRFAFGEFGQADGSRENTCRAMEKGATGDVGGEGVFHCVG